MIIEVWIIWLFVCVGTRRYRLALRERIRPERRRHVAAHRPLSRRQQDHVESLSGWNRELAGTESDAFADQPLDRLWAPDSSAEPAPIYQQIRDLEPEPLDEAAIAFPEFDLELREALALAALEMDLLELEFELKQDLAEAGW